LQLFLKGFSKILIFDMIKLQNLYGLFKNKIKKTLTSLSFFSAPCLIHYKKIAKKSFQSLF